MNSNSTGSQKLIHLDPFQNLIFRFNKSPLLKPAVVSTRSQLLVSKSADDKKQKLKLFSVNSSKKIRNSNFEPVLNRENLKTPNFKPAPKENLEEVSSKSKQLIPKIFLRGKLKKRGELINSNKDVSFGDTEEDLLEITKNEY